MKTKKKKEHKRPVSKYLKDVEARKDALNKDMRYRCGGGYRIIKKALTGRNY